MRNTKIVGIVRNFCIMLFTKLKNKKEELRPKLKHENTEAIKNNYSLFII